MTHRLVDPAPGRVGTTVAGSYPIPAWLAALPSAPNLADALLVAGRDRFEGRGARQPEPGLRASAVA